MYEATTLLTDLGVAPSETAVQSAFVLLPGTVGNGVYRRKVIGTGVSGLPKTMDIRAEVLPPTATRRYSVGRLTVVVNETVSMYAGFGPPPVVASSHTLNIPFGEVDNVQLPFSDGAERCRVHMGWLLQYFVGSAFSMTATTGDAAKLTDLIPLADWAAAVGGLMDGVR